MKYTFKKIAWMSMVMFVLSMAACTPAGDAQTTTSPYPWENGGKQPAEYTYEEFEALTSDLQIAFQESFANKEDFNNWLQQVQYVPTDLPWKNGGKLPEEYTYAEFEMLTSGQQIAFQNSFESQDAFNLWLEEARWGSLYLPWKDGGKQPAEYTYEEYMALSELQKDAFQEHFGNVEKFNDWLKSVDAGQVELPWLTEGKQPADYTYEEFDKLSPAQQIAFQQSFGGDGAFESWLKKVKPAEENADEDLPWENGGKQPEDYTYEEFEKLTPAQQIAFQNSFGSIQAFDQWLRKVQYEEENLPWENGEKQPKDYTYDEFVKLTPAQQMAFQNSFASLEAFDKWLKANRP